jgi:hypothetical protein
VSAVPQLTDDLLRCSELTLCANNGCEQLQQGASTELLRQQPRRNGGLRDTEIEMDLWIDAGFLRLKTD